jgi:hypothetical protein
VFSNLVDCMKIPAEHERVKCYDARLASLDEAERRQDVAIVDRAEMNRTRRSLFGFNIPKLKLFGRDDGAASAPAFSTIETRLSDARRTGGAWMLTLEDGANWLQTDSSDLARPPKPGQPIRIRRGAVGSFLANIDGQIAIRVRRVN